MNLNTSSSARLCGAAKTRMARAIREEIEQTAKRSCSDRRTLYDDRPPGIEGSHRDLDGRSHGRAWRAGQADGPCHRQGRPRSVRLLSDRDASHARTCMGSQMNWLVRLAAQCAGTRRARVRPRRSRRVRLVGRTGLVRCYRPGDEASTTDLDKLATVVRACRHCRSLRILPERHAYPAQHGNLRAGDVMAALRRSLQHRSDKLS